MKKIYLIPNFVTTVNLFCGFYSVIASIKGDFVWAAWLIVAAACFDMLDGRIARLAKATSTFGVEYDSMSDLVSFGVAPSLLVFQWALGTFDRLGWLAAFLFLACGALRLARYNINSERLPKGAFQGLPIPAGAGVIATFVIFNAAFEWPGTVADSTTRYMALVFTLVLASLMVSTIPFPSFKEFNWRSKATFGILMVGVLTMVLALVKPEATLFVALVVYIGLSLLWNLICLVRGSPVAQLKESDGFTKR